MIPETQNPKFNFLEFFSKNKFIIALLVFAVINIFVSYFYIGYRPQLEKDAFEYLEAAKFLEGQPISGEIQLGRIITTPLFLYSSIFVDHFFKDFSVSFSLVNIIFYFLCTLAFYFLVLEIYKEKRTAFLSSVLVVFNYYMIDPSNAHLADMSSWFFFILATLFAIKYINTFDRKFYYFSVLLAATGVLFKEYGGLALGNLILLVCLSDMPRKQKLKDILAATVLVLAPLLSYHIFIYVKYHYLYFDRFLNVETASSVSGFEPKSFSLLIKILGWLFSFGWLAFCWGLREELKAMNANRLKILLAILPVTLSFYIWPAITQRLAVMFMMWLAVIAGFGLSKIKWYWLYFFVGVYILFNYNIKFLIDIINLPF